MMCCRLIGQRCGICRVVAMMPNCGMPSNEFRGSGDGFFWPCRIAAGRRPSLRGGGSRTRRQTPQGAPERRGGPRFSTSMQPC